MGEQYARQLASRGLNLVLVARRGEVLEALAKDLAKPGEIEVRTLALDLGRPEALPEIQDTTADVEVGLLIYNAALSLIGSFLQRPVEEYREEQEVNCRRPLELVHHFAGPMAERRRGGILLMSSLAETQGSPFISHYGASKAWNTVFAEGLWGELGELGIDVLACRAGATRTPKYLRDSGDESRSAFVPEMEPAPVVSPATDQLFPR